MVLYLLLQALLYWQLFTSPVLAQKLSSEDRERHRQDVAAPNFPLHAPPEPWDEQTCQSALYPNIRLTFSWGEPLRPTRLYRILEMSRRKMQAYERAGYGEYPLPGRRYTIDYNEAIRMALVAQTRRQMFGSHTFTLNDVLASIDLLELRGLARKEYFEMWAYVFVGDVQVGFIYIVRGDATVSTGQLNSTSSISVS